MLCYQEIDGGLNLMYQILGFKIAESFLRRLWMELRENLLFLDIKRVKKNNIAGIKERK